MITFKHTAPPPMFPSSERSDLVIEFRFDETGEAKATEVIDVFRAFMLAIGYAPETINEVLPR